MSAIVFLQENSLFWLIILWAFFSYLLWDVYKTSYPDRSSFDITIVGGLFTLFLHRLIYILFFTKDYSSNYWSWNPFAWVDGERIFLGSKPWVIFAFWYGGFDFRILLICVALLLLIISNLQQIPLKQLLNEVLRKAVILFPIFLVASYFLNVLVGNNLNSFFAISFLKIEGSRHPVQLYLFLLWILACVLRSFVCHRYEITKEVDGLGIAIFMLISSSVVLRYFAYNIPAFVINWLVVTSIILFAFGLFIILFNMFNKDGVRGKIEPKTSKFISFNSSNLNNINKRWTIKK